MIFKHGKKRVLVADDDKDFLSVTQSLLEFSGFKADTAENGEDALEKIKKHKYDLLILDVVMPKIDGIRLFQMAKKSKKYAKVPVIFVSGHVNKDRLEERQREIVDKADGYIEKPFKTKTFLDTVGGLLKK
jgi:CheY-like chemotaxis protein